MKKVLKIILCVVLVALIAGGTVLAIKLPHPLNYDIKSIRSIGSTVKVVSKTEDCVTIQNTENRDFKVITFTDMHLDGNNKTSILTITNLVNNITKEKPDLVILGGDNVTSALNKKRVNQLARIFENLGVYWAAVLGNHEGDNFGSVSRREMIETFSSYEHCLTLEGPEDIWGDGNCYINILNADGTLCHTFILMDSGSRMSAEQKAQYGYPEDERPYDGVKENQVQWYKEVIAKNKEQYGEFESTVILHIPLPQMETEAEKGEFLTGDKREGVCASGFDSGLFDAIKEMGSTTKVFFGHDHVNDFALMCDGIMLSYMQASGYGSYTAASKFGYEEKDWLQGYTLFEISPEGTYEPVHHRNSENMQ